MRVKKERGLEELKERERGRKKGGKGLLKREKGGILLRKC